MTRNPSDMTLVIDKLIQSRAGGRVERCHGIPHQGSYNNAAHSWGVAMLMWYLFPDDFERLVIYCLAHDVPEAWTGDIPAPTMRYLPGLREQLGPIEDALCHINGLPGEHDLDPEDHAKLKICDRLEFYLWCREQLLLGNRFAEESLHEIQSYLRQEGVLTGRASRLFGELESMELLPRQAGVMREACE